MSSRSPSSTPDDELSAVADVPPGAPAERHEEVLFAPGQVDVVGVLRRHVAAAPQERPHVGVVVADADVRVVRADVFVQPLGTAVDELVAAALELPALDVAGVEHHGPEIRDADVRRRGERRLDQSLPNLEDWKQPDRLFCLEADEQVKFRVRVLRLQSQRLVLVEETRLTRPLDVRVPLVAVAVVELDNLDGHGLREDRRSSRCVRCRRHPRLRSSRSLCPNRPIRPKSADSPADSAAP